jgi:hypothetical protein
LGRVLLKKYGRGKRVLRKEVLSDEKEGVIETFFEEVGYD